MPDVQFNFRYTEHFRQRLVERFGQININDFINRILSSDKTYKVQRPTSALAIMLNGYKRAEYIWNEPLDLLMVLEEAEPPILRTTYRASESSWMKKYLKHVPIKERIKFNNSNKSLTR
jgi:hypothetical protein